MPPRRRSIIRYCCTFSNTIADVLDGRGWERVGIDDEWDFVWGDRDIVYDVFDNTHLSSCQRLNHYRNGRELCRKDLLIKNLKRKRRTLEKKGHYEEANEYEFFPVTYVLPREYAMFVEEFKRRGGVWIMKPIGQAQGKGIFLFSRLREIREWKTDYKALSGVGGGGGSSGGDDDTQVEAYVVQQYISNPLLVGGKKFDLRLYALVTSFSPLQVHQYRRGFARFTQTRYSSEPADIANNFMHLTNVAIQKKSENYDPVSGGKLELQALKMYLFSQYGVERVDALFWDIQMILIRSLEAVQPVMISDKHCFELYGYDVMIDEELKPWLIEVNASPALTANTPDDYSMKFEMLNGMLDVVDMEGQRGSCGGHDGGGGEEEEEEEEEHVSGFDLIYDNGYIEIDPELCGYTSFLGSQVHTPSPFASSPCQPRLGKKKRKKRGMMESEMNEVKEGEEKSSGCIQDVDHK